MKFLVVFWDGEQSTVDYPNIVECAVDLTRKDPERILMISRLPEDE